MDGTIINVVVSIVLAAVLTKYDIVCNQQGFIYIVLVTIMFLHHFGKLFIWLSPLFVSNLWVLIIVTLVWGYVCIQNFIRNNTYQPCILSNIVNVMCGHSEEEMLRDIMYHIGLKKDVHVYLKYFNIASWILLFMLISKIMYIMRVKSKYND
jgi:polyferredoxin